MGEGECLDVKGVDRQGNLRVIGKPKPAALLISRYDLIGRQFLNSLIAHFAGFCSMYSTIRRNGFSPALMRQKW